MRPMLKKLPLVIGVIGLAGCSNPFGKEGYLRDKSGDYTQARVTEPLKVPERLHDAKPLDSALVIPKTAYTGQVLPEAFEVPRPSQRLIGQGGEAVYSLERQGDDVWVQAVQSPSEIEARVNAFFENKKLPLSEHSAQQNTLETEWVHFDSEGEYGVVLRTIGKLVGVKDLDPMEDRFLIKVRKGGKPNTSEVHIQHKGRTPVKSGEHAPVPAQWNNLGERSQRMNQALASDMLIFFAGNQDGDSTSYQDQNRDMSGSAELTQDGNGSPLLTIKGMPYGRSWSAVGDALDAAGVSIIDRNRSAGIYYLPADAKAAVQPEEKSGFFARWFGSDNKEVKAVSQDTLLLRVSQFPDLIQVSVEKDSATSVDKETSETLLALIKDRLK
ncbi:outer membrane protein assembly factor BamC [Endozoicomonas sp.]|nr:outer membrane protein assembly factor BamC [Endozoicomonas sp.]